MLPVNNIPYIGLYSGVSAVDSPRGVSRTNSNRTDQVNEVKAVVPTDTVELSGLYNAQNYAHMMHVMGSRPQAETPFGFAGGAFGGGDGAATEEGQAESASVLAYENRAGDSTAGSLAGVPAQATASAPGSSSSADEASGEGAGSAVDGDGSESTETAAGRGGAGAGGEAELTEEEQQTVDELAARDREVRQHEAAHQAVGGAYAGAASFSFQQGPDGKNYAVGGEVSIDTSDAETPEATAAKMRIVRAAAMAPANPSGQDFSVAAAASQREMQAMQEAAEQRQEETQAAQAEQTGESPEPGATGAAGSAENDAEGESESAAAADAAAGTAASSRTGEIPELSPMSSLSGGMPASAVAAYGQNNGGSRLIDLVA